MIDAFISCIVKYRFYLLMYSKSHPISVKLHGTWDVTNVICASKPGHGVSPKESWCVRVFCHKQLDSKYIHYLHTEASDGCVCFVCKQYRCNYLFHQIHILQSIGDYSKNIFIFSTVSSFTIYWQYQQKICVLVITTQKQIMLWLIYP